MPKVRVHNLAISLDGYAAGPHQSLDHPLGVRGTRLHEWDSNHDVPHDHPDYRVRISGPPSRRRRRLRAAE